MLWREPLSKTRRRRWSRSLLAKSAWFRFFRDKNQNLPLKFRAELVSRKNIEHQLGWIFRRRFLRRGKDRNRRLREKIHSARFSREFSRNASCPARALESRSWAKESEYFASQGDQRRFENFRPSIELPNPDFREKREHRQNGEKDPRRQWKSLHRAEISHLPNHRSEGKTDSRNHLQF